MAKIVKFEKLQESAKRSFALENKACRQTEDLVIYSMTFYSAGGSQMQQETWLGKVALEIGAFQEVK